MEVRTGSEQDDTILVEHYLALWDSYGTPPDHYAEDARERILAFIRDGRNNCQIGVFIAYSDGKPVGSAASQLQRSPYPNPIKPEFRKFGYVWSVYVEPEHRGKGIARELMQRAIAHLQEIGCTMAVLNSSEAGQSLYERLGFQMAKEMRLPLMGVILPH